VSPAARPDDLRVVASGLRFPEGPIALRDGGVLLVEVRGATLCRVGPDGEVSVLAQLGGGPNGAALGPDGSVYVCNNGGLPFHERPDGSWGVGDPRTGSLQPDDYSGGRIERVDPRSGAVATLYREADGRPLRGPNDLVFDSSGGFWFTDTGKTRARERDHGALYYAAADGSSIREVAAPLLGPNGVGLSPDGGRLYVAETPTGRLRGWELAGPGELAPGTPPLGRVLMRLPGELVFDSFAVDAQGCILAAIPNAGALACISPDGALELIELGEPMPTNVCFGGADLRTAFVTIGGSGRLCAFRWRQPGLPLAFRA
jgi:gluconolactonase